MTRACTATIRPGFTLLEILISVVVLALGLVGIVAVFPAVIDLQRRAQDAVVGTSSAASAEAQLTGMLVESGSLDWIDWEQDVPGAAGASREELFPAFDVLRLDRSISDAEGPSIGLTTDLTFEWETDWTWPRRMNQDAEDVLLATGDLVVGGGTSAIPIVTDQDLLPEFTLAVGDRLMPDGASGAPPRYVYDLVVRRVDAGVGLPVGVRGVRRLRNERIEELPLQVAVFVRRIDRGIRVAPGQTLRSVLADEGDNNVRPRDRRFPLAVKSADFAAPVPNASPSSDSVRYSRPVEAQLTQTAIDRSGDEGPWDLVNPTGLRFERSVQTESGIDRLSIVGQLFVDNTGVVRRVTKVGPKRGDTGGTDFLTIDPPFASNSHNEFRQIVFTPQVPADVRVFTAQPR